MTTREDARRLANDMVAAWEATFGPKEEAWQPIETAPKDGTRVLLFAPNGDMAASRWNGSWWDIGATEDRKSRLFYEFGQPTHWRPLPAPPQSPDA